jgi:hypothetical protein
VTSNCRAILTTTATDNASSGSVGMGSSSHAPPGSLCRTIAASRPDGCGNNVPITIVRRPDGRLRVRAGHRRSFGCLRAGVPVLGFVAGAEGDEAADRRARLIEQWHEHHHRMPMTVRDDTAVLLCLFDEEQMTEAAIAKATGLPQSPRTCPPGRLPGAPVSTAKSGSPRSSA